MQDQVSYPIIDCLATGRMIKELREARGLSVRNLQTFLGFENPQAIYKWQRGESLPSLDNLVALSKFLQVPMDEVIVLQQPTHIAKEPQALPAALIFAGYFSHSSARRTAAILATRFSLSSDCYGIAGIK